MLSEHQAHVELGGDAYHGGERRYRAIWEVEGGL